MVICQHGQKNTWNASSLLVLQVNVNKFHQEGLVSFFNGRFISKIYHITKKFFFLQKCILQSMTKLLANSAKLSCWRSMHSSKPKLNIYNLPVMNWLFVEMSCRSSLCTQTKQGKRFEKLIRCKLQIEIESFLFINLTKGAKCHTVKRVCLLQISYVLLVRKVHSYTLYRCIFSVLFNLYLFESTTKKLLH